MKLVVSGLLNKQIAVEFESNKERPNMKDESEPMKVRTMTQPICVTIADDHPAIRERLAAIFRSQNDIEMVVEARKPWESKSTNSYPTEQLSPKI